MAKQGGENRLFGIEFSIKIKYLNTRFYFYVAKQSFFRSWKWKNNCQIHREPISVRLVDYLVLQNK